MNQDTVFFSFVIPTYNRANFIGKTIDSLLLQQYNNYEIIVVDDGSTDNTEEVLKKYVQKNVIYVKKENGERASARNFGTRIARGEYINWFDSDDIAFPNHLSEAKKMIELYSTPELFALPYQLQKVSGEIIYKTKYPVPTINIQLLNGNALACNPVFVRKDIAIQFPFNEDRNLSGSEDYELWMRLSVRFPIYCGNIITSALIEHNARSMNSISGNNMLQRYNLIMKYLTEDDIFSKRNSKYIHRVEGNLCLLVALFFSLENNKRIAIRYLLNSLYNAPSILFTRRMLAVIKYLILK